MNLPLICTAYYCYLHDDGFLMEKGGNPGDAEHCCSECYRLHCEIDTVTVHLSTDGKKIVRIDGLNPPLYYERLAGGFDVQTYASEIYDKSGKKLSFIK